MKKIRHRFSTLLLLLFLLLLVLVCLAMDSLELTYGLRQDLSFNELTTTSATTNDILAEIYTPVHIYALYQKGDEYEPLLEVLKRYRALNPLLTYEVADVTLNPNLVNRFKGDAENPLTQDCLVVYCPATDRYKIIRPANLISQSYNVALETYITELNFEKALTEAIVYVTREEIPEIALLHGHDELSDTATGYLTEFLSSNNYHISFVDLKSEGALDDTKLLFILSAQKDLSTSDLTALLSFLNRGGSLFITCDVIDPIQSMPNFLSLLRLYGFVPLEGATVSAADEPNTYYSDRPYIILPTIEDTPATRSMLLGGDDTLMLLWARAFETPVQTDKNLKAQTVLYSSYNAYLSDINREDYTQQPNDPTGPFTMAVLSERLMESTELSRAFIIGSSTMLTSGEQYAITDSGTFVLRMVQYLIGQEGISLAIEQKPAVRPGLSASSQNMGVALIVLAPLLVLIAALIVLVPRRHR